jgi:hypothetical protein
MTLTGETEELEKKACTNDTWTETVANLGLYDERPVNNFIA